MPEEIVIPGVGPLTLRRVYTRRLAAGRLTITDRSLTARANRQLSSTTFWHPGDPANINGVMLFDADPIDREADYRRLTGRYGPDTALWALLPPPPESTRPPTQQDQTERGGLFADPEVRIGFAEGEARQAREREMEARLAEAAARVREAETRAEMAEAGRIAAETELKRLRAMLAAYATAGD